MELSGTQVHFAIRLPVRHGQRYFPASAGRRSAGRCGRLSWPDTWRCRLASSVHPSTVALPLNRVTPMLAVQRYIVRVQLVRLAEGSREFSRRWLPSVLRLQWVAHSGLPASPRTHHRPDGPRCRLRVRRTPDVCALCCNNRSPMSWPSVSLRFLKLSRSMNRQCTFPAAARTGNQCLLEPIHQKPPVGQVG